MSPHTSSRPPPGSLFQRPSCRLIPPPAWTRPQAHRARGSRSTLPPPPKLLWSEGCGAPCPGPPRSGFKIPSFQLRCTRGSVCDVLSTSEGAVLGLSVSTGPASHFLGRAGGLERRWKAWGCTRCPQWLRGHALRLVGALGPLSPGGIRRRLPSNPRLAGALHRDGGRERPGLLPEAGLPCKSASSDGTDHPAAALEGAPPPGYTAPCGPGR